MSQGPPLSYDGVGNPMASSSYGYDPTRDPWTNCAHGVIPSSFPPGMPAPAGWIFPSCQYARSCYVCYYVAWMNAKVKANQYRDLPNQFSQMSIYGSEYDEYNGPRRAARAPQSSIKDTHKHKHSKKRDSDEETVTILIREATSDDESCITVPGLEFRGDTLVETDKDKKPSRKGEPDNSPKKDAHRHEHGHEHGHGKPKAAAAPKKDKSSVAEPRPESRHHHRSSRDKTDTRDKHSTRPRREPNEEFSDTPTPTVRQSQHHHHKSTPTKKPGKPAPVPIAQPTPNRDNLVKGANPVKDWLDKYG